MIKKVLLTVTGMFLSAAVLADTPVFNFDPAWGQSGDGRVITAVSATTTAGVGAVAVQGDGKVLAAGWADQPLYGGTIQMVVLRYLADGSLDASFGSGGQAVVPFMGEFGYYPGVESRVRAITLQSDGRIVLAGEARDGLNYFIAVARVNADGSIDASFNQGRIVTVGYTSSTLPSSLAWGNAVALQPDGKIVVVGQAVAPVSGGNSDFAVVRLLADGQLDRTFRFSGRPLYPMGPFSDGAWGVAIQPDGKIVIAGESMGFSPIWSQISVLRVSSTGVPDSTFGASGKVFVTLGSTESRAFSMSLDTQGRIVLAGHARISPNGLTRAVARLTPAGALDTTFGGSGYIARPLNTGPSEIRAVRLLADGRIVLGGTSWWTPDGDADYYVERLTGSGDADVTFNQTGVAVFPMGAATQDAGAGLAIQADGRVLLGGSVAASVRTDFGVARLLP